MRKEMSSKRAKAILVEPGGVEDYIANCPNESQDKLRAVRKAVRDVAPGAVETLSYFQIPGYSYPGYDYNGMFAWFSFEKATIRLHVRPPVIQNHKRDLVGYKATKAIVSFPVNREIPTALVKKLVRASLAAMKSGAEGGRAA
jgi:uncharacterized protein YdhG (YjbR/CyaY superfamily)